MIHLERTRGALLDIVIEIRRSKYFSLVPSLDVVGPLAHRWHRLLIYRRHGFAGDEPNDTTLAQTVIERISHLQFPSLKRFEISYWNGSLDFLSPARAPALEHMELDEFVAQQTDFPPVTTLKTLNVGFYGSRRDNSSFPYLIPTQTLTKLSLSGFTKAFSFQPNSIHFPSLKTLEILCPEKEREFMDAIVAPNFERLVYTSFDYRNPLFTILGGCRSKFTNVRHLFFDRHRRGTSKQCFAMPSRFVKLSLVYVMWN